MTNPSTLAHTINKEKILVAKALFLRNIPLLMVVKISRKRANKAPLMRNLMSKKAVKWVNLRDAGTLKGPLGRWSSLLRNGRSQDTVILMRKLESPKDILLIKLLKLLVSQESHLMIISSCWDRERFMDTIFRSTLIRDLDCWELMLKVAERIIRIPTKERPRNLKMVACLNRWLALIFLRENGKRCEM